MKLRWILLLGLAVVAASGLYFWLRPEVAGPKAVAETRRALRQQGFKTELTDFDFSASHELRRRSATLTNTSFAFGAPSRMDYRRRSALQEGKPDLMAMVGADSAIVAWQQVKLESQSGEDLWPMLRESLDASGPELDAGCAAALSGPIQFHLSATNGSAMLLPHLAALKNLTRTFATRAVLELHDAHQDAAWTNLLAATRLATAYQPESVEISHLLRFACATIAHQAAWQVLQAGGWSDDRLARLQGEWEAVDFFKGLPETAAFTRASVVATCQQERQQPIGGPGLSFAEVLRSPREAWSNLKEYWKQVQYRRHGTYEDEQALLLHYRERELELRRAVSCSTWSEMRQLPGVTNRVLFQSKYRSTMQSLMNLRQISLSYMMYSSPGQGQGLPARAADAEARRRVIITAIAVECYRGRHGSYPKALPDLAPELLTNSPTDFMDGRPLRYRLTEDGHFVLYSVGLDCVDDGGKIGRPAPPRIPYPTLPSADEARTPSFGLPQGADLGWPCPTSPAEVEALQREQMKTLQQATDRDEQAQANEQWR